MTLEKALFYLTHHSESIIQWLFLMILLLAAFLIARALFSKRENAAFSAAGAGVGSGEIQGVLEKILERTTKLEAVSLQGMDAQGLQNMETQIQSLKKDLASKEAELAKAATGGATSAGSAAAAASSVDTDKLSTRIKELEAKLAEYEILEDDIADLSLYKEENARMRIELDKFKAEPGAAAPAAASVVEPAGEAIVAEFAEAVQQETVKDDAPIPAVSTGDTMADFENVMNLGKKMLAGEPVVAAGESTPVAVASPTPAAVVGEQDDLFAEFSAAALTDEEPAAHALDTSKVLDELANLSSLTGESGTKALDESIDTEKMAQEATALIKS